MYSVILSIDMSEIRISEHAQKLHAVHKFAVFDKRDVPPTENVNLELYI